MTKHVERGCSLDDCSLAVRVVAAQHADEHHPTRVRRPTPEEWQANLEILRRRLMTGWHGGPLEGAGR